MLFLLSSSNLTTAPVWTHSPAAIMKRAVSFGRGKRAKGKKAKRKEKLFCSPIPRFSGSPILDLLS